MIEAEKLKEILRLHKLWLKSEPEGKRADLRGANLSGMDLSDADMSRTDLCGANLSRTNLTDADMSGANLSGARNIAVISAGPQGRSNRITYYKYEIDEVDCGCFQGTLDEFAATIEATHRDNPAHLATYRATVELFRAARDARKGK
jgi:hypothetical protein